MSYIKPENRHQTTLFTSFDDLISSDNPVRYLDMLVEKLFYELEKECLPEHNNVGRPAYDKKTMFKLFLYGYFNGIRSSRKLEVETHRNMELMWLIGLLKPDHWTIANYRRENFELLKNFSRRLTNFLIKKDYIKLEKVAIDGSKIKANANRDMLTKEKINNQLLRIDEELNNYFTSLEEIDLKDDNQQKRITTQKLKKLLKKKKNRKALLEYIKDKDLNYISPTDLDAALVKAREGKFAGYNIQATVDVENKLVVDVVVTNKANDYNQLPEVIESLKKETGKVPEVILVDSGYYNPDQTQAIENKEGIEILMPAKESLHEKEEIKFEYNEEKDEYICSEGKSLVLKSRNILKKKSRANIYQGKECKGCPLREKCTKSKRGRIITRYINQKWREEHNNKMKLEHIKQEMKSRGSTVEHVFGNLKSAMGKIPLLLRGKLKVTIEILFQVLAYNVKRLFNIAGMDKIRGQFAEYS